MTRTQPSPGLPSQDQSPDPVQNRHRNRDQDQPLAVRVPASLRVSAAERLVSVPNRRRAAEHLVANAPDHGIDLDLLWGVLGQGPSAPYVRQVVMGVPSAGKTGMLFLSAPRPERRFGPAPVQTAELAACLRAAVNELPRVSPKPVSISQALIEPEHAWGGRACRDAGMTWVGRLSFLRRRWSPATNPSAFQPVSEWPASVTVETVTDPLDFAPDGSGTALAHALDGTYEDTRDCPELCGLRPTRDVIASHMATGAFDPNRWWLLRVDGAAEGCCLLNHCPASSSVELVYLGLSPRARGMGLGRRLLAHALAHIDLNDVREVTCAVDTRNEPALKLYHAMGFRAFSARIGFVHVSPTQIVEIKPAAPEPTRAASVAEMKPPAPNTQSTGASSSGQPGTSRGQEKVDDAKRL